MAVGLAFDLLSNMRYRAMTIRLDGDLAVDWPRIVSDNIRIRSNRIDARAIVLADIGTGIYTGAIDGRINDYRVDSVGIFNVATDMDLETTGNGGFRLAGQIRARPTRRQIS